MGAELCPDYDGVPEFGGPCWTCRNGRGPCPLDDFDPYMPKCCLCGRYHYGGCG